MGLDMYLNGHKYPFNYTDPQKEDGYNISKIELELGYWRKHPNLHGYIVQEFANGIDECQEITLNSIDIDNIIDALREQKLPYTTGFFFGESEISDEQTKRDIEIFEKAKAWLETKSGRKEYRHIVYRASW